MRTNPNRVGKKGVGLSLFRKTLITSVQRQDNTMVQAMVLLYSSISILGLLLGDIAMMICDPRIKLVRKEGSR